MEVWNHLLLIIRYAESITLLAREDLILLPAANVIARSTLEAGYRAMWLLDPIDPFEREARWVVYLETGVEHYKKLSQSKVIDPSLRNEFLARYEQCSEFAKRIRLLLLNENISVNSKYPGFNEVIAAQSLPDCYHLFILLSAYTHGNFAALEHYREHLGTAKRMGEFIEANDWKLPLSVAGAILFYVAERFLKNIDVDVSECFKPTLIRKFNEMLKSL